MMNAVKCRFQGRPVNGLEGEVHAELVKRHGEERAGLPDAVSTRGALNDAERRALDSGTGGGAVPTILGKDWIELLRNQMVLKAAGMREVFDIEGRFAIRARAAPRPPTGSASPAPDREQPDARPVRLHAQDDRRVHGHLAALASSWRTSRARRSSSRKT